MGEVEKAVEIYLNNFLIRKVYFVANKTIFVEYYLKNTVENKTDNTDKFNAGKL